ncbi:STAS domain-containing protein [Tindallia californiensis]|uniref:Stage II sporulation protein AA (Anti-sigma F factor antagonist) n=1 Tax=Tindallia californiensis TaxID=159292 RepID=A0A1H3IGR1_9FIRM|nr:STAS domain-containing protein [Tindallia californiensis]SDY26851.1 stage II sporulation protein AA (anti-sigma F factor antagonist) [Tindallia californiensis]
MNYIIQEKQLTFYLAQNPTATNVNTFLQYMYQVLDSKELINEVIIDFDEVQYVDSTGITFLIGLYRHLARGDRKMRITNAKKEIMDLFEIVNLTELFQVNK